MFICVILVFVISLNNGGNIILSFIFMVIVVVIYIDKYFLKIFIFSF